MRTFFSGTIKTARRRQDEGRKLYKLKKYKDAEDAFRQALFLRQSSPDQPETLDNRHWLACAIQEQRRFSDAEEQFRLAVKGRERVLGREHADTLNSKHWLGYTLYDQKKYDEASIYFRSAAEGRERAFGANNSETLRSKHWLANSLFNRTKYSEAEQIFREVVFGKEKTLGREHNETLNNKHWLGCAVYYQRSNDEEAEKLFREAVELRSKTLGPLHSETLRSKHGYGCTLYNQKKYTEAEKILCEVAQGRELALPKHDSDTLWSKTMLARTLYDQQKYHEAEGLFRQVKEAQEHCNKDEIQGYDAAKGIERCIAARQKPASIKSDDALKIVESKEAFDQGQNTMVPGVQSRRDASPINLPSVMVMGQSQQESSQTLTNNLDDFFDNQTTRSSYSDLEISTISSLLERSNPRWSKVPRTYVVLRTINCLNLLDDLISSGFSDYWFPAIAKNLPPVLRPSQASEFVDSQHLVLTKSLDLEKGQKGQHCYFDQDESLPFIKQRILGHGGFGQVDEVLSQISHKKYARKRVLRRKIFRSGQLEDLQLFVTEIETLKRLSHKHVVDFVGSYSDRKYLGLLMYPVAEMDLSDYLTRPDISSYLGELRTFFGCLVAALDYLHKQHVRHKDIKPGNILVNRGNIMLTDFGLALDYTDTQGSVTTGMVNGMTPRYCAPEVAAFEPRGTSSDIWSLGVVFLEMLVVLKGQTISYMEEFLRTHGSQQPFVRTNSGGLLELTAALKTQGKSSDNRPIRWINDMLLKDRDARPTAGLLLATISDPRGDGEHGAHNFCGICCGPYHDDDDDDFSD